MVARTYGEIWQYLRLTGVAHLKIPALLLAIVLPGSICAQQTDVIGPYVTTFRTYERCVLAYSERFAKTPEVPLDIVAAAISACGNERSAFLTAVIGMRLALGPDFGDPTAVTERFDNTLRGSAIRSVLEKRYPDSK